MPLSVFRRRHRMLRSRLFFFQAEDGIRDFHVTGVQTCALPILHPFLPLPPLLYPSPSLSSHLTFTDFSASSNTEQQIPSQSISGRSCRNFRKSRSEERRVGKECR